MLAVVVADGAAAVPVLVGGLLAAWVLSPWSVVVPHTPHHEAAARAGADGLVAYWRPGCTVALSLLARLPRRHRRRLVLVNVVREHAAAEFVRARRGGDMVTPTVVTPAGALVEATPAAIAERLDASD